MLCTFSFLKYIAAEWPGAEEEPCETLSGNYIDDSILYKSREHYVNSLTCNLHAHGSD